MSRGQLLVSPHDLYLTIGETVGTPEARFPDCGLHWTHIRPPVCVEAWPYTYDPASRRFTTVSSWLGGEYVTDGDRVLFGNDKRISFLQFLGLPARTSSELELALYFKPSPDAADADDPELFQRNGWRVRHALDVASTPSGSGLTYRPREGSSAASSHRASSFRSLD
jgi:hypothetical protein